MTNHNKSWITQVTLYGDEAVEKSSTKVVEHNKGIAQNQRCQHIVRWESGVCSAFGVAASLTAAANPVWIVESFRICRLVEVIVTSVQRKTHLFGKKSQVLCRSVR